MIGKRYGLLALHSNRAYKNHVPTGLILPYQGGTTAPTGWDLYAAANDLWIVGAGDTYAVDETDATHNDIIYTTNDSTYHAGTDFNTIRDGGIFSEGAAGTANKYTGTHTATVEDFEPGTEQLVFIKAQANNAKYPQNTLVLSISDIAGLSVVKDNARLLKAGATITSVASQVADSVTSSASGNHDHRTGTTTGNVVGEVPCFDYTPAGDHTHTIGLTLTAQIKRYYLSAWTNASADFANVSGIIGMYESTTPPSGWYLCNGDNGTPDLRDHFIQLDSAANDNQNAGDNTVNGTVATCSSAGGHNHKGNSHTGYAQAVDHSDTAGAHDNHTIATEDIAFVPPYFALAFIMKG